MLRQRRPRGYSDDPDVEVERRDKTFKSPVRFRDWSLSRKIGAGVVLVVIGVAALLAYRAATLAVLQEPHAAGALGMTCEDLGATTGDGGKASKFTFVLLGHLSLPDKDFRSSLRAIQPHIAPDDSIVIGLRKKRKFEHMVKLVKEELRGILASTPVKLCESNHAHEAWRELWKRKYVTKDFVVMDQIALLSSSWRDWMIDMKKKNPKSILSLQSANDRFVIGTDNKAQFKISTVPSFAAIVPPMQLWSEFLQWFDNDKTQYSRISGTALPNDIPDDGWEEQSLGHHASWTKPFAQFIATKKYKVLHAHPAAAFSLYEKSMR